MTTNVFDELHGVIAADTRWSTMLPSKWMVFLDEEKYPKLVIREDGTDKFGFLFAGEGLAIQTWKNWIKNPVSSIRPPSTHMAICVID